MREDSTYSEIFNYAVGEETEPGSTMKLASMIAAIEEGAVALDDTIDIKDGKRTFYDKVMRDSDDKTQGVIKVKKAFEVSSNVAISRIIHENFNKVPERFISYLSEMGLTEKTVSILKESLRLTLKTQAIERAGQVLHCLGCLLAMNLN